MLLTVLWLSAFFIFYGNGQNQFCADMKPQNSVDIDQLMGIWFGVEILIHNTDDKGLVEYSDVCPVIHISEVEMPTTVAAYGYGTEYGYGDEYGRTFSTKFSTTPRPTGIYDEQQIYGRGVYASGSPYLHKHRKREEWRKLRLLWDEGRWNIEYTLRFNSSRAGFWISSGPQNGSLLEKQYDQFAGTIQVMKAVGNHLLLTFCHQLPDRTLFSILLAREPRLSYQEILGVHNLLKRRDLLLGQIRKVCNSGAIINSNKSLYLVLMLCLLLYRNFSTNR